MSDIEPSPEKLNHRVGLSDEDKLEIIRLINTYASQRGPQSGPNDMQRRSAFHRLLAASPASTIEFNLGVGFIY